MQNRCQIQVSAVLSHFNDLKRERDRRPRSFGAYRYVLDTGADDRVRCAANALLELAICGTLSVP